jgi:hypothetical protein
MAGWPNRLVKIGLGFIGFAFAIDVIDKPFYRYTAERFHDVAKNGLPRTAAIHTCHAPRPRSVAGSDYELSDGNGTRWYSGPNEIWPKLHSPTGHIVTLRFKETSPTGSAEHYIQTFVTPAYFKAVCGHETSRTGIEIRYKPFRLPIIVDDFEKFDASLRGGSWLMSVFAVIATAGGYALLSRDNSVPRKKSVHSHPLLYRAVKQTLKAVLFIRSHLRRGRR